MALLDFKEIPRANDASGRQDSFELFARDFLKYRGYSVVSGPDRGTDAGRDLIVLESRVGVGGETKIRWLVSCKHKAHSGRSVTLNDELDIYDRMNNHQCGGFIGFYSTVPASGLHGKLEGIKNSYKIDLQIYDSERIESELLETLEGQRLAKRFFPRSLTIEKRSQLVTLAALLRHTDEHLRFVSAWLTETEDLFRGHRQSMQRYSADRHKRDRYGRGRKGFSPKSSRSRCFDDLQRSMVIRSENDFKEISKTACVESLKALKSLDSMITLAQDRLLRVSKSNNVLAQSIISQLDRLKVNSSVVLRDTPKLLKCNSLLELFFHNSTTVRDVTDNLVEARTNIETIKWTALDFVIDSLEIKTKAIG